MAKRGSSKILGLALGAVAVYGLVKAYRQAKAHCPPFERSVSQGPWKAVTLFSELWQQPELVAALLTDLKIEGRLAQKILVAIVGAHGGALPLFGGWGASLTQGLSEDEVNSLLSGQVAAATVAEAPALAFAQHYLEMRGEPDQDMVDQLVATYGAAQAQALTTFVRLGIMASLVGNTLDAFISRVLGQPAPGSSLEDELKTLLTFFFGILPLTPVLIGRALWQMPQVQAHLSTDE